MKYSVVKQQLLHGGVTVPSPIWFNRFIFEGAKIEV